MSNQILWDCHMHSSFSADSDTSMEDMILEAIRRGLHGICFTEHLDPDYPPTPDNETFELDLAGYQNTLYALRDKYRSELEIHYGIELGLQPHLEASFRELLETVPFDFVIGSSHVVHGYDPYYKEFFKNRRESECYMEYFESILENLAVFSEMDVYGHIDYVVRYGPNQNREYSYGRYQDILDEILRTIISRGCGIPVDSIMDLANLIPAVRSFAATVSLAERSSRSVLTHTVRTKFPTPSTRLPIFLSTVDLHIILYSKTVSRNLSNYDSDFQIRSF